MQNSVQASRRPDADSTRAETFYELLESDLQLLAAELKKLDGFAHQTLSTFTRNGLDADTRGIGETNFGHAHFIDQKLNAI